MKLGNLIRKLMHKEQPQEYGDYETRDNYLRSLRRERRIQMEEVEKKILKKKIEEYRKRKREKHLWGVRENLLKSKNKFKPDHKQKWL